MAHKLISVVWVLMITSFVVVGQSPLKWGKYEDFEIEMTSVPFEPDAPAVILAEYGQIFFDSHVNYKVHRRIKILKEEGKDYANAQTLKFYNRNLYKMYGVRAQIRTASGEIIKLDSESILKNRDTKDYSSIDFVFPNVEVGSILEYEFTYQYDQFYFLPTWYFQGELPIVFSMLDARLPGGITYRINLQGERLRKKYAERELGTFSLSDMPSLKDADYVYNVYKYAESVSFYLDSYEYRNMQRGYSSSYSSEFNSLKDIYRQYYLHDYYRTWLSDRYLDQLEGVDQLAGSSELETIQNIYRFVKDKIQWTGEHSFFVPDDKSEIIRTRKARSGEMNLIIRSILQKYGIESEIVLISTRSNGFPEEGTPAINQFNHLVLYLEQGGGILLDATEPYYDFLTLPPKDQNFKGLIFNKEDSRWITIAPNLSKLTCNYELVPEENKLITRISATAHDAAAMRREFDEKGKLSLENFGEEFYHLTSVERDFPENFRQPVKIAATYETELDTESDMLYIPAQLFRFYDNVPFRETTRKYPIELPYPVYRQVIGLIRIPEGFEVESLPSKLTVELPDKLGHYRFHAAVMGNVIQLNSTMEIPAIIILPERYAVFRNMIEQIVAKQNEMIVLRRIEQ